MYKVKLLNTAEKSGWVKSSNSVWVSSTVSISKTTIIGNHSIIDFPNLPYLIDGDLKLTQSKAILYYIGRKFNLMGATPTEEGRVMMLCEEAHDFRAKLSGFCYGPTGGSDEARQQFVDTVVKEDLKKFENYFTNKKTNFSASDHVTVADFQLFDYLDAGFTMDQSNSVVKEFPHIQRFLTSIRELPELKEYIAKMQAEVPFNNKGK